MKAICRSLVYSNVHIMLVAAGLVTGTWALLGREGSWPVLGVACSGAYLIYLADRGWLFRDEDHINQPERVLWYEAHPRYVWISAFLVAGLGLCCIYFLSPYVVLFGLLLGGGALFYLRIEGPGGFRPKAHWLLKPCMISSAWVAGGVIFPAIAGNSPVDAPVLGLAGYRFPLIIANVLLADWPDREGDAASDLKSLASMLSVKGLRNLVIVFSLVSLIAGGLYAVWRAWPPLYYLDLAGPVLMIAVAWRFDAIPNWTQGFVADMIVALPLVTAIVIHLGWISIL